MGKGYAPVHYRFATQEIQDQSQKKRAHETAAITQHAMHGERGAPAARLGGAHRACGEGGRIRINQHVVDKANRGRHAISRTGCKADDGACGHGHEHHHDYPPAAPDTDGDFVPDHAARRSRQFHEHGDYGRDQEIGLPIPLRRSEHQKRHHPGSQREHFPGMDAIADGIRDGGFILERADKCGKLATVFHPGRVTPRHQKRHHQQRKKAASRR